MFHLASFACSAASCVRMYLCRNDDVQMLKSSSSVLFVVFIFRSVVVVVANLVVWSRLTSMYIFPKKKKTVQSILFDSFSFLSLFLKCTNSSSFAFFRRFRENRLFTSWMHKYLLDVRMPCERRFVEIKPTKK